MIKLSIVIPVYNEQDKIEHDIFDADAYLTSERITGEIIIVDDGSTDETSTVAGNAAERIQRHCVVERSEQNRGKGHAVRTGILKSRGEYVLFADSGVCVPFTDTQIGIDLIDSGQCQIACGSRKLSGGHILRPQSFYRRICSKLFHWFLIHDFKKLCNLADTQCGFKVYRGDVARELYAQSSIDGFVFDIEVILLAMSGGYTIREFPVNWTCDPDSRLKPAREAVRIFIDLVRLKRRFNQLL